MDFESAQQTAERLGVTVRAVQKWAAAGKIPGAKKVGREWMIPAGGYDPRVKDNTADITYTNEEKPFRQALPLLSGAFMVGKCHEYINSISDEDDRNIALGEYYYYSGQAERAAEIFEPYLSSSDPSLRYSAETTYVFINIALGRTHLARFAIHELDKQMSEGLKSDALIEIHAMGVMTAHALAVLLHQPSIPDVPPLEEYLRFLPGGMKLWACYILAYRAFQQKNYERALTTADLAMALVPELYPIPMIYCQLVAVISLLSLMRVDEAKERFSRLWDMVKEDGFVEIVSEHYGSLQGIIDAYFKKSDPKTYEQLMGSVRNFGLNWIKLHNLLSGRDVADNLTATEFTVAMLYNRGWSAQEISAHLSLSEHTIRSYVKTIYIKLGISDKKALSQFMLH